jgi:hypothetical protein
MNQDLVAKLAHEIAQQELFSHVLLFVGCSLVALLLGFTFGRGGKLTFKLLAGNQQQLAGRERGFAI